MSRGRAAGLLSTALLLAASCASVPTTHYYLLEPARVSPDATATDHPARIGVAGFDIDSPYDQDRIVYRVGSDSPEVGFYEYHRWAAPLGRMLPTLVADALAIEGQFEPLRRHGTYDAVLHGRLLVLEEVDLPEGQQIRIRMVLSLADRAGEEIGSEVVAVEQMIRTREVEEVVRAMAEALREAARSAREPLAALFRAHVDGEQVP